MINFLSSGHRKYLLLPMVLVLSACTSKPREVYASIPLVTNNEAKPSTKEIPEAFSTKLSNPSIEQLTHGKYAVKLSPLYISALGYPCRKLIFSEQTGEPKRRVACEISYKDSANKLVKSWFLENAIIESSNNIDL
ncbi:hypothetical protein MT390_18515 [Vibrio sp. 2-Bac 85]